jgi:hypothetical protein
VSVFLVNTLVGVVLIVVSIGARLTRQRSRWWAGLALLPLLAAALLAAYVFGEDSYRDNGDSRWDAYRSPGGALGPMFVLSLGLMTLSAALLAFAGLSRNTALGAADRARCWSNGAVSPQRDRARLQPELVESCSRDIRERWRK